MRAFVAIDVGGPLEPTAPDGAEHAPAHLTLAFLGEVPAERIPAISAALRPVAADAASFELTVGGIGAFPSHRTPRVVWVGVTTGREEVRRLAAAIADALSPIGFPRDPHDIVPHVTLFRVRSAASRARARRLLDGSETPPPTRSLRIGEIVLKESTRTRDGRGHRTLERFPLSGRPSVGV
ncbi:MAG: RNA 2',3'-cyclic phosphodiesterase [Thermoplasmata archaeon]